MPETDSQDISLDALWFFATHALGIVALCALVFFILGLWVGFLTWAKFKRRARAYYEELQIQRSEIANLKRRIAQETVESEVEEDATPLLSPALLETAISPKPPAPIPVSLPVQTPSPSPTAEVMAPSAEPRTSAPKKDSLASAVLGRPNKPKIIEVATVPAEKAESSAQTTAPEAATTVETVAPPADTPSAPVLAPAAPAPPAKLEIPAISSTRPLGAVGMTQVLAKSVDDSRPLSESAATNGAKSPIRAATSEQPSGNSELEASLRTGRAAVDEKLGIVYHERPERYDDLTLLRGVGDALHTKLQELGIYTFRQIAMWTEAHVREFDARLVAKDRIRREQWIKQARNLHFLKYGEQLKAPAESASSPVAASA